MKIWWSKKKRMRLRETVPCHLTEVAQEDGDRPRRRLLCPQALF